MASFLGRPRCRQSLDGYWVTSSAGCIRLHQGYFFFLKSKIEGFLFMFSDPTGELHHGPLRWGSQSVVSFRMNHRQPSASRSNLHSAFFHLWLSPPSPTSPSYTFTQNSAVCLSPTCPAYFALLYLWRLSRGRLRQSAELFTSRTGGAMLLLSFLLCWCPVCLTRILGFDFILGSFVRPLEPGIAFASQPVPPRQSLWD